MHFFLTPQERLARALSYNYHKSADWNKDIFDAWAQRILDNKEFAPDFLMKVMPKSRLRIPNRDGEKLTTTHYSFTEESNLLLSIRRQYAQQKTSTKD